MSDAPPKKLPPTGRRPAQIPTKTPIGGMVPSPDEPHPSGRVMVRDFDYLTVAQDIIARSDEAELETLITAIRERQRELGLPAEPSTGPQRREPVSGVLKRRPHEGGELVLETRAYTRKDGTKTRRGPYWYFHHRAGGANKTIYLGKTDDPEGKLREKRPDLLKA